MLGACIRLGIVMAAAAIAHFVHKVQTPHATVSPTTNNCAAIIWLPVLVTIRLTSRLMIVQAIL